MKWIAQDQHSAPAFSTSTQHQKQTLRVSVVPLDIGSEHQHPPLTQSITAAPKMEHAGGEAGEAGAPEMQPHAAARSLSTLSKPSPRLSLDLLLLQVILKVFWIDWKVTKTISIPFFHLKCAKWSTLVEKPEKAEPRKWNHMPLLAASVHPQNHLQGCT